jgi:hypothetical protein
MSYLTEYTKTTISEFKGLYKRGIPDETPIDHAICCENNDFHEKGEWSTRGGAGVSLSLNHSTSRFFLANTNGTAHLLTLDFSGNIYADSNGTPIWSDANIIDFQAINLFNRVYILPVTAGPAAFLLVWDGVNPVRLAAGFGPSTGCTAATGSTGWIDPGVHQFGVSFVTSTGFITRPGAETGGVFTPTLYTAPGGAQVTLSGIPTGGSDIVARYIVATQANETLFFFVPNGLINDNTTTTITLNFYDTDLQDSADYLFDLLEEIPAATIAGALYTYHSRLFIAPGTNYCNVSDPSDPESFDDVDGLITLPNPAYNTIRAFCQLYDTLYLVKSTGITSTYDNSDLPSTWQIIEVDGTHGGFQNSIATVSVTSPALGENEMFLTCDLGGIFTFNGAMSVIPLTWKVDDIWQLITPSALYNITIMLDPFKQIFYCLIPVQGSSAANLLLVGDYTEGLDPMKIKWTIYTFPFVPCAIALYNYADGIGAQMYSLKFATQANNFVFKVESQFNADLGIGINSYYQHYLNTVDEGSINLFRAIRYRATGIGSLVSSIWPQDLQTSINLPNIALSTSPGQDYLNQTNMMNEKMAVLISNSSNPGDFITVQRVDIFAKPKFHARPA